MPDRLVRGRSTDMMSAAGTTDTPDLGGRARLRLKPQAPATGFVDGGWWPRSRDLPNELPALVAVLAIRLNHVESVSYNLDDWRPAPRKIMIGGAVVRLAGYRSQRRGTIDVLGARQRLTLLVVPPESMPSSAHTALMASGHRGNTDDIEALLRGSADDDPAELRWELDGGPVRAGS
jgi:Family of unknown function (DUF5994)